MKVSPVDPETKFPGNGWRFCWTVKERFAGEKRSMARPSMKSWSVRSIYYLVSIGAIENASMQFTRPAIGTTSPNFANGGSSAGGAGAGACRR